jgi:ADP-ribose pyrophosphatase
MTGKSAQGGSVLGEIVLGAEDQEGRLRFYCEVMGLGLPAGDPAEIRVPGPDSAEAVALAEMVMAAYGKQAAPAVRRRLGSLRVAAASRVRAGLNSGPGLRQGTGEVTIHRRDPGFAGFFGLDVLRLSHRRFDGTLSPVLEREVFLAGDAVTVLPYDPVRDRVLLIEQMRMGPLGRGDPLPWQIEAIAGRIDPGESPEDCARREAVEEAGLRLGRLEKVAEYYPSPGAVSEYLYSYVALCDLPDDIAGLFGAEAEAEDIRGMLLGHDALMAALQAGRIANAPLILSVLWLDRERARLRREAGEIPGDRI